MAKYEKLTQYIKDFENSVPGQLRFSDALNDFIVDIHNAWEELNMNDYIEFLNTHGIEWGYHSMVEAEATSLPDEVVITLLLAAVRADRINEGILLRFIEEGHIVRWLKILLERDQSH